MLRLTPLTRRIRPNPVPELARIHTDEMPMPVFTALRPESYGTDFNLIRAVKDHAPIRIENNRKEIQLMTSKMALLEEENSQLQKLLTVLN